MTDRYSLNTQARLPFYFRATDSFRVWEKFANSADQEFEKWNQALDAIEIARSPDTIPSSELRHKISNIGGSIPSYFPDATRVIWTRQLVQFFKAKQSHENIENAIQTVLGIAVNLRAPWSATPVYTVGESLVGLDTIIQVGTKYSPAHPDAYVVGSAIVGDALVDAHGINIHVPRTIFVLFQIVPSEDQLLAVRFLVDLLKPAEEHCIFITPNLGQCWILGESTLFLDTVLCASSSEEECFTVDVSRVGLSTTVCGPTPAPGSVLTIVGPQILPDEGEAPTEETAVLCFAAILPDQGTNPAQFTTIVCDPDLLDGNDITGSDGISVVTLGSLIV